MRSTIIAILVLAAGNAAFACGPEDSLAKLGAGRGRAGGLARNGGFAGGFDPRLAYARQMNPSQVAMSQVAQHHQLLAMQAAAYRARRAPIKLAKALALREYKLAKREERKAWVLAKQEAWKRKKALDEAPTESESPDAGQVLLASVDVGSIR